MNTSLQFTTYFFTFLNYQPLQDAQETNSVSFQYQQRVSKGLSFNLLQPTSPLWSLFDNTLPDLGHMWAGVTVDTRGPQNLPGTRLLSPPVGPHAPSPNTWVPICPLPNLTVHYEWRDGDDDDEKDTHR